MYFSKNIPGVNPVAMNYKIRHNKNQPCDVCGQTAFFVFGGGRKTGKYGMDMQGYVQEEGGRKATCMEEGLTT